MQTIRASLTPLRENCPASGMAKEGEILVKTTGKPAIVGRAVHAICQDIVVQKLDTVPDLEPYAIEHGLEGDETELKILSYFFLQAWNGNGDDPGLSEKIVDPICEQRMEHPADEDPDTVLSGQPDLRGWRREDPRRLVILDVKSGWKAEESDYIAQLKTYAWLAMKEADLEKDQDVTVIILWLRDRTYSTLIFTCTELKDWMDNLIKRIAGWKVDQYETGEYCQWCPRSPSCPGRLESLHSGVAIFEKGVDLIHDEKGGLLPVGKLIDAWTQSKVLAKAVKAFQDQFKEEAIARGGFDLEDGRKVTVQETAGSPKIDPMKAWPIMASYLSDEEIAPVVTIAKSKLADAIAKTFPKGVKKAAIDKLFAELDEAGAISPGKPSYRLKLEVNDETGG